MLGLPLVVANLSLKKPVAWVRCDGAEKGCEEAVIFPIKMILLKIFYHT